MVGILLFGFVGVSLQGLIITWPWTNWWEHGTWVTMLHAHECMMAFAMGAISLIYFVTPQLTGKPVDRTFTIWGKKAFYLMATGQIMLATGFGLAGLPQIFNYWIRDEPWSVVWSIRQHFLPIILPGALLVFVGALHYAASILRHFFYEVPDQPYESPRPQPTFMNTLKGMPLLILASIILAFIGVAGLWSFSSSHVISELNPVIPYTLAYTAYIGLAFLLWIMIVKFTRALEYQYYDL